MCVVALYEFLSFSLCMWTRSGSPGVPSLSPVSGLGSGRPVENPYLFTSASSPAAAPGIGLPSLGNLQNVHISPMQHPHQQQQQQQLPSIISLDANRLLINAKPVVSVPLLLLLFLLLKKGAGAGRMRIVKCVVMHTDGCWNTLNICTEPMYQK